MRELEQLIMALSAFEKWRVAVDEIHGYEFFGECLFFSYQGALTSSSRDRDVRRARPWKAKLQGLLEKVHRTVDPLLGGWLLHPKDDQEAAEFVAIRTHYIPEVVLAYNSVLHFAGYVMTRDMLLQCLNLATTVASNTNLTKPFVDAGRMSELVDEFGMSSLAILKANEQKSKPGMNKKRAGHGETLEIWQVKPSEP